MRSDRAGFSKEDGTELESFSGAGGVAPDGGSTDPVYGADRRRNQWRGQHEQGPVVFQYSRESFYTWRFVWSAVSTTFFDWLQKFNRYRRFIFYPDTSIPNEYRVRARFTRLPIQQVGDGQVTTVMEIEEW